MARIPLTNGFVLIPEGTYVFLIYGATYDEDFGKIEIKLVTSKGLTHTERFTIKDSTGKLNENALGAFSYFAKTAMNDFEMEDIAPEELIGHFIEAEVIHTQSASKKNPEKTVTFANLGDKAPSNGFAEDPSARVMELFNQEQTKKHPGKSVAKAPSPKASSGLDLDALLG